jgi:hypothetical protein
MTIPSLYARFFSILGYCNKRKGGLDDPEYVNVLILLSLSPSTRPSGSLPLSSSVMAISFRKVRYLDRSYRFWLAINPLARYEMSHSSIARQLSSSHSLMLTMSIYGTPVRLPHERSVSEMDLLSTLQRASTVIPSTMSLAQDRGEPQPDSHSLYHQHDDYQEDPLQQHFMTQYFQKRDSLLRRESFQQNEPSYPAKTPSPAWKKLRSMSLRRKTVVTPVLTTSMISAPIPGSFRGSPYKLGRTSGSSSSRLTASPSHGLLPSSSWTSASAMPTNPFLTPPPPSLLRRPTLQVSEAFYDESEAIAPETPTAAYHTPRILISRSGPSWVSRLSSSPIKLVSSIDDPRLYPSPSRSSALPDSPQALSVEWNSDASLYSHTSTSPLLQQEESSARLQHLKSIRRSCNQPSPEAAPACEPNLTRRALNITNPRLKSPQDLENRGFPKSSPNTGSFSPVERPVYAYSPLRSTPPGKKGSVEQRVVHPPHQPALFTRTASRIKRTIKKAASFASFGAIESPDRNVHIHRSPQLRQPEELQVYEHNTVDMARVGHPEPEPAPVEEAAISLSQIRGAGAHAWYEDGRETTTETVIYEESPVRMMRAQDRAYRVEVVDVQHQPIEAVHVGNSRVESRRSYDEDRQLYVAEIERFYDNASFKDYGDERLHDNQGEEIATLPERPYFLFENSSDYHFTNSNNRYSQQEEFLDPGIQVEGPAESFMAPRRSEQSQTRRAPSPMPYQETNDSIFLKVTHAPSGTTPRKSTSSKRWSPTRENMLRTSVMTTSTTRSQLSAQWYRSPSERLGLRVRLTRLGGRAPWNHGVGDGSGNSERSSTARMLEGDCSSTVKRSGPVPIITDSPSPRRDAGMGVGMGIGIVDGSPVAKKSGWFGRRFGKT